jgi:hypothetical protein
MKARGNLWQVWDDRHRTSAQLRESARAPDERTRAAQAAQLLAAAQPRGLEDRFATCPPGKATTMKNVLTTSARRSIRQCVFCSSGPSDAGSPGIGMGISNCSPTSTSGGFTYTPTGCTATTTPYATYAPAPAYSAPAYPPPPAPEQAQPLVCGVNLDCGSVDTPERVVPTPEQIVSAPEEHAYYKSCAAARAAGVAPLHQGDAGYRSGLDRDGDDIALRVRRPARPVRGLMSGFGGS